MIITNFDKFREQELVGTNGVIKKFMRAFELELLIYMSNGDKPVGPEVSDYYDINEVGQKHLLGLNSELKVFRADYHKGKSAYYIAERLDLSVNIVYPYVKNRTYTKEGVSCGPVRTSVLFKDFSKASEVSYLSSFQILRDIQMDDRFYKLRKK
ncbi:hypothetical protein [Winogradskyella sp. Asnod2-B02-A]|uniref:hypothetical protein n=1 Tax=Winogradskyella sp. Asnod2-B02-A TaxID=3160583 RepID=UPI0038700A87